MAPENPKLTAALPRHSHYEALKFLEPKQLRPRSAAKEQKLTACRGRPDGSPTLRILETIVDFEELREHWSIWSSHPEADIDFFSIGLQHRPGVIRPHVMVVYRGNRPSCILVGWIYQGPLDFKVGSVVLFRTEARLLRFVVGGFLGLQSLENARFLIREILNSLSAHTIHAVNFSQVKVDSPLYNLAKREPSFFCREVFTPTQTHLFLTLPGSFDQYLKSRGRHSGNHLRRCRRMLVRDFAGRVRFQSFRSVSEVENFVHLADAVSRKTYQRALGVGFVNDAETRALFRTAAQRDALRASLLWVDDQPVAFASGIVSGQTLHATSTGYDRAFERYCPGLQTMMHFIEELFQPGETILRLDAGCGDTSYKRRLFDSTWEESPLWIFAPTASGMTLHALRTVSTSLHYAAMRLFEKSDHLRKLKKMWHRHLVEANHR